MPYPKWKPKKSLSSSFTNTCLDWMADATFDDNYNSIKYWEFWFASKHSTLEYFGFVLHGYPMHESVFDM